MRPARLIVFCDDDVQAPRHWLAAHARAHDGHSRTVVNGPIINVPSYDESSEADARELFARVSLHLQRVGAPGGVARSRRLRRALRSVRVGRYRTRRPLTRSRRAPPFFVGRGDLAREARGRELARSGRRARAVERARMARQIHRETSVAARAMPRPARTRQFLARTSDAAVGVAGTTRGAASWDRLPPWLRAIARARFLDGMYMRELIEQPARRTTRGDEPGASIHVPAAVMGDALVASVVARALRRRFETVDAFALPCACRNAGPRSRRRQRADRRRPSRTLARRNDRRSNATMRAS